MADNTPKSGSSLLLDEYFASGNEAFLDELRGVNDPRKIAAFADRWKTDPRPWARQMILKYLAGPLNSIGHNVLVKRLFKEAEKKRDSELMGAFLHAFDTLVRRQRRMKWRWDSTIRQSWKEEELYAAKDNLLPMKMIKAQNPRTGELVLVPSSSRVPKNGRLFSYRTRYYLRRRAWRYFRFMGYQKPAEFPAAVAGALARYVDADLAKGEHILDSWCLLNIAYRKSPVLLFSPSQVKLTEGRSLNDLSPAPKHEKNWASAAGAQPLWGLIAAAQSRLVRLWAMEMLRRHHTAFLGTINAAPLLPLFDSLDSDVQQFATELLEKMPGLPSLSIDTWMQLLQTQDPTALATICGLMLRHVTADRLDLPASISLASATAAPVANLGLAFLRTRPIVTGTDREMLSDLANARCAAAAGAITQFALSILGEKAQYDVALVARFFDAMLQPTRTAAWAWLTKDSAGYNDPALWSRLLETPYEDVRLKLVKELQARQKLPGANADLLVPIWTTVLLGIQRGGRHKIMALHQISRTIADHAEEAARLFPVMGVAIRSVRPAEARVGLAAVVQAVERNSALAATATAQFPELHFVSAGATT